jgi:hypothetical protein
LNVESGSRIGIGIEIKNKSRITSRSGTGRGRTWVEGGRIDSGLAIPLERDIRGSRRQAGE